MRLRKKQLPKNERDFSMQVEESCQVYEHTGEGYQTIFKSVTWRVAVLNSGVKSTPEGIPYFQKHDQTDEVFVLLEGCCVLITASNGKRPDKTRFIPMEKGKAYNIPRGVWHTHVLSENASVFIVENLDTDFCNSPISPLSPEQRREIAEFWRCSSISGA
jgi:mannose-6-phosphate isomerase-like protein (cupin superfamily)